MTTPGVDESVALVSVDGVHVDILKPPPKPHPETECLVVPADERHQTTSNGFHTPRSGVFPRTGSSVIRCGAAGHARSAFDADGVGDRDPRRYQYPSLTREPAPGCVDAAGTLGIDVTDKGGGLPAESTYPRHRGRNALAGVFGLETV